MTKTQLYKELNYVNHSREKRLYYAHLIISEPKLFPHLIDILFSVDDKISCRAAWVLEFVCQNNLSLLIPYLDTFTKNIGRVHFDAAVRPVAKVCEYITKTYYHKNEHSIKKHLTTTHKKRITATCFDWLINDEKVATKAYSMYCLFLLGKDDFNWIYPELITILQRDFHNQSAAFKARAKHILKKINAA